MYRLSRSHTLLWVLALPGMTIATYGCQASRPNHASAHEALLTPGLPIDSSMEVHPTVSVRSEPAGAEVWIGPGCSSPAHTADTHAPSNGRRLGCTPVAARLTTADLSSGGGLEYLIRGEDGVTRSGSIPDADRIIRQGGTIRLNADLLSPFPSAQATP